MYRLQIDWTYSNTSNANVALGNINTALSTAGRSETASRAGSSVTLTIAVIETEAEAVSLRDSLTTAWNSATRSGGRASLERTN